MNRCIVALFYVFSVVYGNESESVIKSVTVYRQYALVTHEALCTVSAGTTGQVIGGITEAVLPTSLQVTVNGQATLLSAVYRHNYLDEQERKQDIALLQDSLKQIEYNLRSITDKLAVFKAEEQVLSVNTKLGSNEQQMTVAELKLLTDYFRSRMLEIKGAALEQSKKSDALQRIKQRIENQLSILNGISTRPTGEVVVTLAAAGTAKVKIVFSYLTSQAGWDPVYDIRSSGSDKPIQLTYKADVHQNTGYDWKNVKLTVSTGNPAVDNKRPLLYPLFVDFHQPMPVLNKSRAAVLEESAAKPQMMENVSDDEQRSDPPEYIVTEQQGQIANEYMIELLQTIPSDGANYKVVIKEYSLPVAYRYHTVPRLNDGAFLLASVTNYGQYNLLPGNANIFSDGMFIGQSFINPQTSSDTLLLSLGRDDKVVVRLQQLNDFTETKMIGMNTKEIKGFEITVRNNRNIAVEIEILDQIPVSRNNDIEVELSESGSALVDTDSGRMLWRYIIAPSQSQKTRFVYSVKYPKGKTIHFFH